jgi:hypothetical protein
LIWRKEGWRGFKEYGKATPVGKGGGQDCYLEHLGEVVLWQRILASRGPLLVLLLTLLDPPERDRDRVFELPLG